MDSPYAPGTLDYQMSQWMMRSDVRAALHVESSPAKEWPGGAVSFHVHTPCLFTSTRRVFPHTVSVHVHSQCLFAFTHPFAILKDLRDRGKYRKHVTALLHWWRPALMKRSRNTDESEGACRERGGVRIADVPAVGSHR